MHLNFDFYFAENINFLTADGKRFAHPLHHLGKSQSDLPLIAIDSFRHMYLFKNYKDIFVDGNLKKFVDDLHSGKLHRYAKNTVAIYVLRLTIVLWLSS